MKELHEPSDNLTLVWAVDPDPVTAPKHQSKLPLYPILPPDTWKSVALVEELQVNWLLESIPQLPLDEVIWVLPEEPALK